MKFFLFIYLLLGMAMSAIITATPSIKFGFFECLFLAAMQIPFVGLGIAIARSSKPTDGGGYTRGMSPFAWGLSIVASYLVGFIAFIVARRW